MAIPSRQIGWSTQSNLLWEISKQLEQLIRVSAPNKIRDLIALFKLRVGFNDGTFEAEACLNATLTNLDNIDLLDKASLIITPNAYNPGVLYDVVPNSNLGDMDVTRATTATRVNELGLIEEVGVNIPRLDYSNGTCPSLLVEPQRTNLVAYSNDFTNVIWQKSGVTVLANSGISPDGNLNADKISFNTNNYILQSITGILTASVYVKGILGETIRFGLGDNVGAGALFTFNGEWQRIVYVGETITQNIFFSTYFGLNPVEFYVYGAQLEQGSYPTSYIPTVATTVTRNADVISKTGISSLIGQTEGTIFLDYNLINFENQELFINTSYDNSISISYLKDTNSFKALVFASGSAFAIESNALTNLGNYKIAFAYKSGNTYLYINGNLIGIYVTAFAFNGGLNDLIINRSGAIFAGDNGKSINSIQLYKTALTDAECIALTTI